MDIKLAKDLDTVAPCWSDAQAEYITHVHDSVARQAATLEKNFHDRMEKYGLEEAISWDASPLLQRRHLLHLVRTLFTDGPHAVAALIRGQMISAHVSVFKRAIDEAMSLAVHEFVHIFSDQMTGVELKDLF